MPEKNYEKFDYKKIEPGSGLQKVILRFNSPQEGDSEYGHWILYGVTINGVDASWFVGEELKDLFTTLKLKKGAELLIRTDYYTKHDKDGKPEPDVYGILEYNGKEYSFGKQENGGKKDQPLQKPVDQPSQTKAEPEPAKPKQEWEDFVLEKYTQALNHVMAEMNKMYEDKQTDHVGFNSADVEKMVVSVFMSLVGRRNN